MIRDITGASEDMAVESLMVIYVFLFGLTSCIMLLYYRKLREGCGRYLRAKDSLSDVVFSFNRDMERQEGKIDGILTNSQKFSSESLRAREEMTSKISGVASELKDLAEAERDLFSRHEYLERKVEQVLAQQSELARKVSELGSLGTKAGVSEPLRGPVMPIVREKVLSSLTETELRVLEMLASEGEKNVSQVRERIRLTREHTARIMKSLFIRGYVERRTERIPYAYRLKDEMADMLKRQSPEL